MAKFIKYDDIRDDVQAFLAKKNTDMPKSFFDTFAGVVAKLIATLDASGYIDAESVLDNLTMLQPIIAAGLLPSEMPGSGLFSPSTAVGESPVLVQKREIAHELHALIEKVQKVADAAPSATVAAPGK
ncbi:MAG: hypothetical protein P1U40_09515 [Coxiellaceae bacterium]|nr:hypothetical protein [Coxiellaceae bacterium]